MKAQKHTQEVYFIAYIEIIIENILKLRAIHLGADWCWDEILINIQHINDRILSFNDNSQFIFINKKTKESTRET